MPTAASVEVRETNSLRQGLFDSIAAIVCQALLVTCGGELPSANNSNYYDAADDDGSKKWRQDLCTLARTTMSWTTAAESALSYNKQAEVVDGKPWDIEVRAAPAVFHRFKDRRSGRLMIVSDLGLPRTIRSPRELGELLSLPIEEACGEAGICYYVRSNPSGILCIVTPDRAERLREAGRLPCPRCVHFCRGEKGLWWHQQEQHGADHSEATAFAVSQRTTADALVVYNATKQSSSRRSLYAVCKENERRGNGVFATSGNGDPLEHVKIGDLNALRISVSKGYNPKMEVDAKGASPLLWAAGAGHVQMVRYLIEECRCDAGFRQQGKRAFEGRTALHWAARKGHLSVVRYLVDVCGVDLDAVTSDGTTAFCWAAWQNHLDVMQFLHRRGCNCVAVNSFGCNAVLWCAQGAGNVQTMEWLESVGCCPIHLVNGNGHGVLHKTAQRGRRDVCEWYLATLGCTENNGRDEEELVARTSNNQMIVSWVAQAVAPDGDGYAPSDLAGMEGHHELASYLAQQECRLMRRLAATESWNAPDWLREESSPGSTTTVCLSDQPAHDVWEPWAGVRRMRPALDHEYLPTT